MNEIKISFFDGNIKNTDPTKEISIGEFLNQIKYGQFKEVAEKVSSIKDKEERKVIKAAILPYVTMTGVYSKRSTNGLKTHSGLWAVDIDGMETSEEVDELKNKLKGDPYTVAAFKSVSGLGLCVIVRIDTDTKFQKDHERWLEKYYYDSYGVGVDKNALGISRARFVSFDENIFINPKAAKIAGKLKEKKSKIKPIQWKATGSQMDRIVSEIHNNHPMFADEYETHVTIGMALATEYGEGGREYFHAICMGSPKYKQKEVDRKFTNAITTGSGSVTIGTFFYLCRQAGIELYTKEERSAYSVAITAKKGKSDISGAIITAKSMGVPEAISEPIAKMVFESDDISLDDEGGSDIQKLMAFIAMNSDLIYNEVTRAIEHRATGDRLEDRFMSSLYVNAKMQIGDNVKITDMYHIVESDMTESVHPFKEWREANDHLPSKPGVIDEFIDILTLKDPRSRIFIRRWLLGLPATINHETVRLVLVLVGAQKDGKTEWFRKLLPNELQKYYAESDLLHGNAADRDILMSSKIIVMDDEFGGKSKKDAQAFKAIASKEKMSFRKAYGRNEEERSRICLLCGTTNDSQIISDATGNSRILPVQLKNGYDFAKFNKFDKNQLLIEIFRAYEKGESWKLTEEDDKILLEASEDYSVIDIEKEMIEKYFSEPVGTEFNVFMTSTEIKAYIEKRSGQRLNTNRFGTVLNNIFKVSQKRLKAGPRKGFYVVENEPSYQSSVNEVPMTVEKSQSVNNQGFSPF